MSTGKATFNSIWRSCQSTSVSKSRRAECAVSEMICRMVLDISLRSTEMATRNGPFSTTETEWADSAAHIRSPRRTCRCPKPPTSWGDPRRAENGWQRLPSATTLPLRHLVKDANDVAPPHRDRCARTGFRDDPDQPRAHDRSPYPPLGAIPSRSVPSIASPKDVDERAGIGFLRRPPRAARTDKHGILRQVEIGEDHICTRECSRIDQKNLAVRATKRSQRLLLQRIKAGKGRRHRRHRIRDRLR